MNIFIDHVGDGHKNYIMAITSILYNKYLRRRCVTKKGNVAQVEFYNNRCNLHQERYTKRHSVIGYANDLFVFSCDSSTDTIKTCINSVQYTATNFNHSVLFKWGLVEITK